MGAFLVLRKGSFPDDAHAMSEMMHSAKRMGFRNAVELDTDHYRIRLFPKIGDNHPAALERYQNGDFAFACGTLIYRGRIGRAAVDSLYRALGDSDKLPVDCYGHFALLLYRKGCLTLLGDCFGGYQIYYDMEQRVVTSSFLINAAALPSFSFSVQNVYEYIFNGVVSGNDTLLREIVRLPIGVALRLSRTGFEHHKSRHSPPVDYDDQPLDVHLDLVQNILDDYFSGVAAASPNGVRSALSGGYDSRLLLALLRRHGIAPRLYVYGTNDDPDVVLARKIAEGEGLPLEVIDKGSGIAAPDAFPEVVDENYWSNDGHVWAGLFDNGAEACERRRRVAGGVVGMNGGGGEVLRNFFYLRDADYSLRQLLWSFYSRFDPVCCTAMFLPEFYFCRLEEKLRELIGDIDRLSPATVSWLYHRFRCRSWDGKVNSENNRYGYAVLPFQESRLTELAARVPLHYRNHGAFEAALIRRADQKLSRYTSNYGHSFCGEPPLSRRIADYGSILRPTSIRRFSFRLQHRLKTAKALHVNLQQISPILPGKLDFVSQFFHVDRIRDPGQFKRVLSLEFLARRFGSKVDPAVG